MASNASFLPHEEERLESQLREHILVCRRRLCDDDDDEELEICDHNIVIITKNFLIELVQSRKRLQGLLDTEENEPSEATPGTPWTPDALPSKEVAIQPPDFSETPVPDGVTPYDLSQVLEHISACLPQIEGGANQFNVFKDCPHSTIVIGKDVVYKSLGEQATLEVKVDQKDTKIAMLEQKIVAQAQNIELLRDTDELLEKNNAMLGRLGDTV